jgi:hypothetical protein
MTIFDRFLLYLIAAIMVGELLGKAAAYHKWF